MPDVYEWTWGGGAAGPGFPATPNNRYQCESADIPQINSTGSSQQEARDLFVSAWNGVHESNLTESDFTFMPQE